MYGSLPHSSHVSEPHGPLPTAQSIPHQPNESYSGGVYCKDTSSGIHDVAVSSNESQSLRAPRAPTLSSAGGLRGGTFGTPFDAGSTMMATFRRFLGHYCD